VPKTVVQVGKKYTYLESIVIIIMVIVGELIRNRAMGWATEKSMFHFWQTRDIFDFQWSY
jgi:vancomycin permeability regulator SanA